MLSAAARPRSQRCCLRELAILRHFGRHKHPQLLGLRSILPPPGGHLADWRELYLVPTRAHHGPVPPAHPRGGARR